MEAFFSSKKKWGDSREKIYWTVYKKTEKLNAFSVFLLVLSLLLQDHLNLKMNYVLSNPVFKSKIQSVLKRKYDTTLIYMMDYLKNKENGDMQVLEEMKEKIRTKKNIKSSQNQPVILAVPSETQVEKGEREILPPKKGHGGGKNTNREGKGFEELTENLSKLLEQGFVYNYWNITSKNAFTLSKTFGSRLAIPVSGGAEGAVENMDEKGGENLWEKRILYLAQGGFRTFMKNEYGLNFPRYPDEAYLVVYSNGRKVLKILEKKAQNVEGSADTKLMAAGAFREEYRFFGEGKFEVEYAFCLNDFFKDKFHSTSDAKNRKYIFLQQLLKKEGIEVFYGEDADYFDHLSEWIHRDSNSVSSR